MQEKVHISENRRRVTFFETEVKKSPSHPFQLTLKLLKLSYKMNIVKNVFDRKRRL